MTAGMNSPHVSKHYDHLLPKTVSGADSSHKAPSTNARTTVNFFKSSIHGSTNNHVSAASRDSHRGLGGGWNGQVIVDASENGFTSPPRAPSGNKSITEIPGLTYLQVKVSILFYLRALWSHFLYIV